jgi:hypothetical protein
MAQTSGICNVTGRPVAKDLLDHITPTSGTVATAVTITGPLKMAMQTAAVANDTPATTHECSDANYARVAISAYNADATASGAGYNVGKVTKANTSDLIFGGAGGFAVAQTFTGHIDASSDATPVETFYENFAATIAVLANQQYVVAAGTGSWGIS